MSMPIPPFGSQEDVAKAEIVLARLRHQAGGDAERLKVLVGGALSSGDLPAVPAHDRAANQLWLVRVTPSNCWRVDATGGAVERVPAKGPVGAAFWDLSQSEVNALLRGRAALLRGNIAWREAVMEHEALVAPVLGSRNAGTQAEVIARLKSELAGLLARLPKERDGTQAEPAWESDLEACESAVRFLSELVELRGWHQRAPDGRRAGELIRGFCQKVRRAGRATTLGRVARDYRLDDPGIVAVAAVLLGHLGGWLQATPRDVANLACGYAPRDVARFMRRLADGTGFARLVWKHEQYLRPNAALLGATPPAGDWEATRRDVERLPVREPRREAEGPKEEKA